MILTYALVLNIAARAFGAKQIPVDGVGVSPPANRMPPPQPPANGTVDRFTLFSPFCERYLVSSLRTCDRVMMRKFYRGDWILDDDFSLQSTNAIRKNCPYTSLGTTDNDDMTITKFAHEFEIVPIDERFSMIFDYTDGGFLQVNQNCVPFVENDDDVGENDNDVDEEKLLWIVARQ